MRSVERGGRAVAVVCTIAAIGSALAGAVGGAMGHKLFSHHALARPGQSVVQGTRQEAQADTTALPTPVVEVQTGIAWKLHAAGVAAHQQERDTEARADYESALTLFRGLNNPQAVATVLADLGDEALVLGETERARRCYAECLRLRERGGGADALQLSEALYRSGSFLHRIGDAAGARRLLTRSLTLRWRETKDPVGIADCLSELSALHSEQGNEAAARARVNEALALYTQAARPESHAATLGVLGDVALRAGKAEEAEALYARGLAFWQERHHRRWSASFLARLGQAAYRLGQNERAERLCRRSLALYVAESGTGGTAAPLARARALFVLGDLALRSDNRDQARALHARALALRQRAGNPLAVAESLDALERVTAARDTTDVPPLSR